MKYRKLKKKLKNHHYLQFEGFCLYFDEIIVKFWLEGTKLRKKPIKKYDYVCEGDYDSFICEVHEWVLNSNKEIKECLKNEKAVLKRTID